MPIQSKLCCRNPNEEERLELILQDLDGLTNLQKNILRERYIVVLQDFNRRCRFYSILYYVGHFIITVGSLIVPALMSIQYADTGSAFVQKQNFQTIVYWVTWVLSLMVTTSNGIITLFKVDKKYFFLHTTQERLRSEGWQYFELTGRYSGQLIQYELTPNHSNQFIFFTHAVEKIKMRQIEEEYYKQEDTHANPQQKGSAATATTPVATAKISTNTIADELYTPSPEKPIEMINKAVPTAVQDAVNAIIQSNTVRGNLPNIQVGDARAPQEPNNKKEESSMPV
jgi:hypothetical protein